VSRLSEDDVPVGLVFVAMATLALLSPAQPDTWTHLRAGREMWTTGELITIERFSFTSAGVPWHNHEWLSQVLFYSVYSIGGPQLLTLLTAGCAFIAALTTWRTMRGEFESRLILLALLVVLLPSGWAPATGYWRSAGMVGPDDGGLGQRAWRRAVRRAHRPRRGV
jgi:hypothetical protein